MICAIGDIRSCSLISLLVYSLRKLRHLQVIRDGLPCMHIRQQEKVEMPSMMILCINSACCLDVESCSFKISTCC